MQQMYPEEASNTWQRTYSGYTDNTEYRNQFADPAEQKLHARDDEMFADLLTQKIREELKRESRPAEGTSPGMRLALAIVSLCLLVPLFGLLVLALTIGHVTGDATIALGWGTVAVCAAIIFVNAYYNRAGGSAARKQDWNKQACAQDIRKDA